ncbi:hypothetical protein G3D70_000941 [Escherichia coli]|nr:hypothetical protein [Escherichia coli]OAF91237.1 hypothetical protein PPECC79_37410 [Escherichia coli PCN079]EFI8833984.1 hypothetical protein [Escherichia coli]EGO6604910.1 hypothetical protein [Escherichia coli]HAH4683894.1 hypothetical protein [Escherichia coli]
MHFLPLSQIKKPYEEELQLPSLRVNIKQNNFTTILKYVRNPDSDKTKQGG